jgi:hypothetical protein
LLLPGNCWSTAAAVAAAILPGVAQKASEYYKGRIYECFEMQKRPSASEWLAVLQGRVTPAANCVTSSWLPTL